MPSARTTQAETWKIADEWSYSWKSYRIDAARHKQYEHSSSALNSLYFVLCAIPLHHSLSDKSLQGTANSSHSKPHTLQMNNALVNWMRVVRLYLHSHEIQADEIQINGSERTKWIEEEAIEHLMLMRLFMFYRDKKITGKKRDKIKLTKEKHLFFLVSEWWSTTGDENGGAVAPLTFSHIHRKDCEIPW